MSRYLKDLFEDFENVDFEDVKDRLENVRVKGLTGETGTITEVTDYRGGDITVTWDEDDTVDSHVFFTWMLNDPNLVVLDDE